jgi:phosphoribosyl-AMP cyclohydrolase
MITVELEPAFVDDSTLLPAVAQDWHSGEVLMLAWMNRESLVRTIETGRATYYSRSRQEIWTKGETSGCHQWVESIHLDCDRDAILLKVRQTGPACHEGYRSCFFRRWSDGSFRVEGKPMPTGTGDKH